MTEHYRAQVQQPPLAGVAPGDVVWVPVFTSDEAGGASFWMRITAAGPVDGRHQDVTGVRVVGHLDASRLAETDRAITLRLPLDRVARRVFVPVNERPTSVVGRAQVGNALPQRRPTGSPESTG
jgi:hypothetical protein